MEALTVLNQGPELGQVRLSADLDYYKPTMSQLAYHKQSGCEVTFSLKNRGSNRLVDQVSSEELQARLERFRSGWEVDELGYLATQAASDGRPLFDSGYLDYLSSSDLPPVDIGNDTNGDLEVETSGQWPLVSFWETVVMSELNEAYFDNKIRDEGLDIEEIYREGDRRLTEKINTLQKHPQIKFIDFGTRRRFSYRWHQHIVERLAEECPNNIVGTSNVFLAKRLGIKPIGTFAHEMPMVYAAIADKEGRNPLDGHSEMLRDWQEFYGDDLSVALTDTFGSEFFFSDFTTEQARHWEGLRHDSGDPYTFGERVIEFYKDHAIDPTTKTLVYSDGLDIDEILRLQEAFKGRINLLFGWGTTLTNDLGLKPNNIIMKATAVDSIPTVKLSDNTGKHTGPADKIDEYQHAVDEVLNRRLVDSLMLKVEV